MTLERLIAEAQVLAGGAHPCHVLGHLWVSIGGRRCPRATAEWEPRCSQTVYQCSACDDVDYGEPGGPAHRECMVEGPCSERCEP